MGSVFLVVFFFLNPFSSQMTPSLVTFSVFPFLRYFFFSDGQGKKVFPIPLYDKFFPDNFFHCFFFFPPRVRFVLTEVD